MITDIKTIGKRAFPNYKGRKFRDDRRGKVTFADLNWSGGTRCEFRAVNLMTGQSAGDTVGLNQTAPWNNVFEGKTVDIPAGFAVVEHSIFCGKDCGLIVYFGSDPQMTTTDQALLGG